jgi:YVTN family beta-propeller protein
VIDVNQRKAIATIPVGAYPEGINYDGATQRIYVASWADDMVSVIDAVTNKVVSRIPTGKQSRAFGEFILKAAN